MQTSVKPLVTRDQFLSTTLQNGESIPVRIERVIYHRTKTMTVRKWCMRTNMIIDVFRGLPAPASVLRL
jgi:hypothetical protein